MTVLQKFSTFGNSASVGAILIESGTLTHEQAGHVVRVQQEQNLRFGDAAILLGYLTEAELSFALAKQFDYAYLPEGESRPVSEELIAAYQPFSPQAEQFRALRSQLGMRWFDRNMKRNSLAIVGVERSVGRSYLAANLAVVFAQMGESTLLIDADMRNPRQHELFKLDNRQGLSMLLSERCDNDCIQPISALGNLSVLPTGPLPPNPQELLNRPVFGAMLANVTERFDVVLIDTPAFSTSMDVHIIARHTGGAFAVARKNQTRLSAFADFGSTLAQSGINVVGSVMNSFSTLRRTV